MTLNGVEVLNSVYLGIGAVSGLWQSQYLSGILGYFIEYPT